MRIRLWGGVDDFDPENILVATGGSDDVADETFTPPIVLGDGTPPTGVGGDDTALYGHTGSDTVQLDGTSGSHIFTRDGEDTVTGTADKTTIHTGDGGDDEVTLTGSDLAIHGGGDGSDNLSATGGGVLWGGDAGDDTLTHIEGGGTGGATVLNGGLGHDTLTGQSGDTFRGGEDITVNVTAPWSRTRRTRRPSGMTTDIIPVIRPTSTPPRALRSTVHLRTVR